MGAGILPTTIHNGKLYFLFGKENEFEDSADGFSDFGGGTDNEESYLETAIREGCEELTGFLGSEQDVRRMLKRSGTYTIDYHSPDPKFPRPYRVHIFPILYDEKLPFYYNNNQRFLQKRLDPKVRKESKIFEKAEIRWVCVDELKRMRSKFRCFFQNIVDDIHSERENIHSFVHKGMLKYSNKNKTRKN
jgi:8-oxo-dGTP pyrophosphatase MutT (NUDIX family)